MISRWWKRLSPEPQFPCNHGQVPRRRFAQLGLSPRFVRWASTESSWRVALSHDAEVAGQSVSMNVMRSAFSSGFKPSARTVLKNSTVSSSVSNRPSCGYGGESLIPRNGDVMMAVGGRHHAVHQLRFVEPLGPQIMLRVVRLVRGWITDAALRFAMENGLDAQFSRGCALRVQRFVDG